MVLRVCGELPMLNITGLQGVWYVTCCVESYQRLKHMVLRVCGELPTLKIEIVKVLWCVANAYN